MIVEHTPVRILYDDYGKAIGRQCEHCATIYTMAGYASISGTQQQPNRRHDRRLTAAIRQAKESR